jgi:CHASE2 domain-containing sensor protein
MKWLRGLTVSAIGIIFRRKPLRYWIEALLLIFLGLAAGEYVSTHAYWLEARYSLYGLMQETNFKHPYVQHTFVVTVDDDDYWKGEFDHRAPVRRDLLARLVKQLTEAQAKVVAVDFDLRSPVPDGNPRETAAYQQETNQLLAAIAKACAEHHAVVLPTTIGFDRNRSYVLQSDIYTGSTLPASFFSTGYIALPQDARAVPLQLPLAGQGLVDSFALAAVRAYRPEALRTIKDLKIFPFGGYLKPDEFPHLTAAQIFGLDETSLQDQVGGKLVFIGSNWHTLAWNTGLLSDVHTTPVGPISGVFVHANYSEAILAENLSWPAHHMLAYSIEILILFSMALLFAVEMAAWKKLAIVLAASVLFISVGYVLLQNLGIYFDFLIPLVFLLLHFAADQILKWRQIALAAERRVG